MKIFTQTLSVIFALTIFFTASVSGQSILNPADSVYTYDTTKPAGTPNNPYGPAFGTIGKWIRTVRMNFNTNEWKCYILNGIPFRLIFPKSYNPTANDGKKYPLLVFFHGAGEVGPATDNELSLANGGQFFTNSIDNGQFDGYILIPQAPLNGWDNSWLDDVKTILDYMVVNNKLDPFRIAANGLSGGGEGAWAMTLRYPNYIAANLPMSGINLGEGDIGNINLFKFTRVWDFQGGLDTSPDPNTAGVVSNEIWAAGGNYRYTLYPTLGHGTWNTVWAEPNFWPFIDSAYASDPWTLFGQTAFCPNTTINVTIGVAPNYSGYKWRKDGQPYGGNTNTINATQLGTYDCQVQRNGVWSDVSHVPVVLSIKQPTVTPPISVSGTMSKVIPDASGKTFVNLQVPDSGYTSYTWEKVGSSTVLDTNRIFKATSPGQYIVSVTQQFGCSSVFSPPFTVINAGGPNGPSAAGGLLAFALSFTKVQLNWTRNPSPVNPETGFEVYRSTNTGGPYTYIGQAKADSVQYIDSNLTANTKYYYIVRAVDATAAAASSNEAGVMTTSDKTPPTAPSNLKVVASTANSVSLIWNQSTDNVGVTKYNIYVNGAKSYVNPVGDTTFTINELVTNTQYGFFVTAIDAAGNESGHSNQATGAAINNGLVYNIYTTPTGWSVLPDFTTLRPVQTGVMPNVSIANSPYTSNFGYTWSGVINITKTGDYTFALSSDDGSSMWWGANPTGSPFINNDGLHGTVTQTGTKHLTAGSSYPVFLEFFQQGGGQVMTLTWACPQLYGNSNQQAIPNSAFAATFNPGGTAPARPINVTATPVSYNKVNVSWTDKSTTETGFEVYRASSLNSVFGILGTTAANATSFSDTTVQASTTYYYRVQSVNKYGASGFDSLSTGGIAWSYYTFDGSWQKMPAFSTLTPVATGNLANVSLSPAQSTVNYAFKFMGYITIKTSATYTFYTSSDDGSDLYVGGFDSAHLVVKNDALQGNTEKSGSIHLNAGRYPVYVTYFQEGGDQVLTVSYSATSPTIAKSVIPDSVWINTASRATTGALPAIPAPPTGLSATAVSPSAINLVWINHGTGATNVQIYRSATDTLHYFLLNTLAPTAVSYSDTGLFSNTTYNYQVRAVNIGGNSAFTARATATTKNVLPVITKLGSQSARYATTTVIPVSATTANSGVLTLTAFNLPPFVTFTDNGNKTGALTANPAITDQGLYPGLYIVATDAFGGKDTTTFSLSVNNNYTPVVDTITSYTMNENDSLNISLTGRDQNPSDTLSFAVSGLPSGYTLIPSGNGAATLRVHPNYAAAGTYTVKVTLNDNNGTSAIRSFVLTVVDKVPTPTKIIYTRFNAGDPVGSPWNNINGNVTTSLLDATGSTTPLGISLAPSSWYVTFNGGPSTGNNSAIYPDNVLRDYLYFGIFGGPDSIFGTVTGADTSQLYNLTFFGSSVWNGVVDNGNTVFRSGNQTGSLYVQNNLSNTVTFTNLKPVNGVINFVMGRRGDAPGGFVNSIVITQQFDDGTIPVAPTNLQAVVSPGRGISLTWLDPSYNETNYLVFRSTGDSLHFSQVGTLAAGTTSYLDSTAAGATVNYYRVAASNSHGTSPYSNVAFTTSADRIPQISPVANININNTQTSQVTVTAVDDASDHLTLTATGLPSFATFTDNGNGTGTIKVTPTPGIQGTWPGITITVQDQSDSSRSTVFNLNVVDPKLRYTYVNITNPAFTAPSPWNNFNIPYLPFAGMFMSGLTDQTGANTGMTVTLTDGWDNLGYTGMKRRNGSDVYPENVSYNSVLTTNTSNHRITLTGMDTSKAYNILFYASHNSSQSTLTNFTINGQTISLEGAENSNKTAELNGLRPDNSGTMVINCQKASSAIFGMISSLVIEAYTPGADTPIAPADLRVLDYSPTGTVSLQWQDRASNETGYEVWRAPAGGTYTLLKSLPAASTFYKDSALTANTAYDYIVRAVNSTKNKKSPYSNTVRGYTYASTVFVNLNNSISPNPGAPFNSLSWVYRSTGNVWNNFKNEAGLPTNVGMDQGPDNWDEVETNGFVTGNATGNNPTMPGIFPNLAMIQSFLNFVGDSSYIIVTGLDASKTYDFTLMGSVSDDGTQNSTSKYTINGNSTLLNAHFNNTGTVTMFGITPDANGNVNIEVSAYDSSNSSFSVLGILIIKGYTPNTSAVSTAPKSTEVTPELISATASSLLAPAATDSLATTITAAPNPFDQSVQMTVPAKGGDNILVQLVGMSGQTVYTKAFDNLVQGNNYMQIQPGNIPSGVYFVKVIYVNRGQQTVIKLIKK